jgi:hypothetical protein
LVINIDINTAGFEGAGTGLGHIDRCRRPRDEESVLTRPIGGNMDNTTLLIILIVVLIVLGGGWYGRGRWY